MAIAAININCNDKGAKGGVSRVWFMSASGVAESAFTRSGGQITSFTGSGSFVEIQTHDESITWETEGEKGENGNGSLVYTHTLNVPVPNLTTAIRNQLEEYANTCELIALIEDNGDYNNGTPNKRLWILGSYSKRRVKMNAPNFNGGQNFNDPKVLTFSFTNRDYVSAFEYTGQAPS